MRFITGSRGSDLHRRAPEENGVLKINFNQTAAEKMESARAPFRPMGARAQGLLGR